MEGLSGIKMRSQGIRREYEEGQPTLTSFWENTCTILTTVEAFCNINIHKWSYLKMDWFVAISQPNTMCSQIKSQDWEWVTSFWVVVKWGPTKHVPAKAISYPLEFDSKTLSLKTLYTYAI